MIGVKRGEGATVVVVVVRGKGAGRVQRLQHARNPQRSIPYIRNTIRVSDWDGKGKGFEKVIMPRSDTRDFGLVMN